MVTPGIGDPYWYEWYVGLERIIEMINPDSNISYVIFQSELHDTLDDVVVGIGKEEEICYQVKHEVGDVGRRGLTFSKLLGAQTTKNGSNKESLLNSLATGWEEATNKENKLITPVLYTNRNLGIRKTTRNFKGESYKALPLDEFLGEIKKNAEQVKYITEFNKFIDDKNLALQWNEFKDSLGDNTLALDFIRSLVIRGNEGSLEDLENNMIHSLQNTFKCNLSVAKNLFDKLCSGLRIWTTSRRKGKIKVTVEDVYDMLSLNFDSEKGEHELPYPMPFFKSREKFARNFIQTLKSTEQKVVWLSGEPGSGKTSLVSYLQIEHKLFKARYHTFKPISPEQKFYNMDPGLSKPEYLWNDLLIQLREYFKGELNKYSIPVTNALCTVEQMRAEVIRLADLLANKTGEKTIICIDGIDHAARANNEITFLYSLFNPDEIPEGVVFVIVGQPSQLYDEYPLWLRSKSNAVQHVQMEPLLKEDIKNLLLQNEHIFEMDKEILSEFIYEKTKGNNLSVAFAIEEAKLCNKIEDYKKILDAKHVSPNITGYYNQIWKYVTTFLNNKNLGFPFPDKVVSSAIILLNGRVQTDTLSKALDINLGKEDWNEVFELLYPLVKKINSDEYGLFHNDFRVFLMANNNKGPKYKDIAFQLAEHFMEDNYSQQSLNNLIPLLTSADKKELIPRVFTAEFVIHFLANGLSKNKLHDYATLAYEVAVESKEWEVYHSVYLAIDTLRQHERYYEYYEKSYKLNDKSYVKLLSSFELKVQEPKVENLKSYKSMFEFCIDLLSFKEPISDSRAESIFDFWMKDFTPTSFIRKILSDKDNQSWDNHLFDQVIILWACLAVKLNKEFINGDDFNDIDDESHAFLLFNDTYFEKYVEINEIDKALEVIYNGAISYSCLEKNLKKILLNNNIEQFSRVLQKLIEKNENIESILLAYVCLIVNNQNPPKINLGEFEEITYIASDSSFKVILLSIIVGYQEYHVDTLVSISIVNQLTQKLEKRDKDYEYLKILMRHGFLIGRTINELNNKTNISNKKQLVNSYKDFLKNAPKLGSFYTFKDGFEILLHISLNHKPLLKMINEEELFGLLRVHLFDVNSLKMYYKTIVLDYLLDNDKESLVKEYIIKVYGVNGENIFNETDIEDVHRQFEKYGKQVVPELIDKVNKKLKWDVVGYVDHKEYALWPLLENFKKLVENSPKEWETRGLEMLKLSNIVDVKGSNRASYDIKHEISLSAVRSGIRDVWQLRQEDDEFLFSLDIIHNQLYELIDISTNYDDIISTWILSCGLFSWYSQDDRIGLKDIYIKCLKKAEKLGYEEIDKILEKVSPEHVKIVRRQKTTNDNRRNLQSDYEKTLETEKENLKFHLKRMKTEEIINFLKFEQNSLMRWDSVNLAWNLIEDRNEVSKNTAEEFIEIVLSRLENYSWEQSGCRTIVNKLVDILGLDFLWILAEYNRNSVNGRDYYTCSSNMEFLLQYVNDLLSIEFTEKAFDEKLKKHYTWITGSGNLNFDYLERNPSKSELLEPKNMIELTCNILLEQILTKNIHRIEISLLGLQLLVEKYPEILYFISNSWEFYTGEQKEYLLLMSHRWSRENIEGFDTLYPHIEKEYIETNDLSKKIQLYPIVKNVDELKIQYTAKEIDYNLDNSISQIIDDSNISVAGINFLKMMENLDGHSNDDIRYFLQNNKTITQDSYSMSEWARPGDSILYPKSYADLDMKVLYGEEKKGRWKNIPLYLKAQTLLNLDDSWILTRMPQVVYNQDWDIEDILIKHLKENNLLKSKPFLNKIIRDNVPKDMLVIGGVVWYPISDEEGLIYIETDKIIKSNGLFC